MADYTDIVEFTEDLNTRITGRSALARRVQYRVQIENGVWPYCNYGVDYGLFKIDTNTFEQSVKKMLNEYQSFVEITPSHVYVADIKIPIS